jgi:hypothetical protein
LKPSVLKVENQVEAEDESPAHSQMFQKFSTSQSVVPEVQMPEALVASMAEEPLVDRLESKVPVVEQVISESDMHFLQES